MASESDFVWTPTPDYIEQSNVWQFMRRHGIGSYEELIERSTADLDWFWRAIVDDLGIEFFEPFHAVLDTSNGIPWSRWFIGGKLNLTHDCLDKHVRDGRRDHLALIWEGEDGAVRKLTYAALQEMTNRLANTLKRLGVARGDRVAVFMPMLPETVAALLACAKIGAVFLPIFSGFGARAVADRLDDGAVKVMLTVDATYRRGVPLPTKSIADEAAALSPTVEHMLVFRRVGKPVAWTPGRDLWWDEAVASESAEAATEPMDAEDPFMIVYTSGTTGKPKGAVHVHGGFLVKIAQEVRQQVDMHADDVLCWVTDMGWIMGPWEVVGGLAQGGTIVLFEGAPDYPAPDRLWRLVDEHRITILGISPTLVRALMRYGDEPVAKHDLSSLRVLASTGEPWNPAPWTWYFEKIGKGTRPVINFSGGTEVGACFLTALTIMPLKSCSLGGPSLGMATDVFDTEGKPLRGGVGELVCTKPWPAMTRGFWNDPGGRRYLATYWSRWPDVWVHGDWASVDADGHWYLHGRSDDTLKISGKRVGPAEIESAVIGHPAVVESAAIGVPHEVKGEAVWCFVVLRPGIAPSDALAREVRDQVIAALGKSFAPEQVRFVADLPRTRSAKILRRAIRARLLNQDPGDLSSLENPSALEEIPRA